MRAQILLGRDNTLELAPEADRRLISDEEQGAIERVVVAVDTVLVDSIDHPEAVWWEKVERRIDGKARPVWVLFLRLGHIEALEGLAGQRHVCPIVFYDPDHPSGLEWDRLTLDIVAPPAPD